VAAGFNTGTTIVTFLMVFLIQHTQTRDTLALQVKLDELILATKAASDAVAGIEEAPEDVVESVKEDLRNRAKMPMESLSERRLMHPRDDMSPANPAERLVTGRENPCA
jgi:low affinity Fe/Cu permease